MMAPDAPTVWLLVRIATNLIVVVTENEQRHSWGLPQHENGFFALRVSVTGWRMANLLDDEAVFLEYPGGTPSCSLRQQRPADGERLLAATTATPDWRPAVPTDQRGPPSC